MSSPNIIFIVTDQQRVDTVGAYGSKVCRTPNMDRLAAAGTTFDNAFTPTAFEMNSFRFQVRPPSSVR